MSNIEVYIYTGMSNRNCFHNTSVTINSMFKECSAAHLPFNALQVIRVCGATAPMSFNSNYLSHSFPLCALYL